MVAVFAANPAAGMAVCVSAGEAAGKDQITLPRWDAMPNPFPVGHPLQTPGQATHLL